MKQAGSARQEQLSELSQRYPNHGPTWAALAEVHVNARRIEEAQQAARRALRLDPSLGQRFSPKLAQACASFMPRPAQPAPAALAPVAAPADRRMPQGNAAAELMQAKAQHGMARIHALEAYTRKFPAEAHGWLALAEESLAHRRIGEAMVALERALALDPNLERLLSPKLESARRFAAKESRGQSRGLPDQEPVSLRDVKPVYSKTARPDEITRRARHPQPPQPARVPASDDEITHRKPYPRPPEAGPRADAQPARSSPRVAKMLERALQVSSPKERIAVLGELKLMAPDDPDVLYHFAVECAQAGQLDEARRTGRVLERISPRRYEELYAWAARYFASQNALGMSAPAQPSANLDELVKQRAPANARTMCLTAPPEEPPARPVLSPARPAQPWAAMQLPALTGSVPQKTQILGMVPGPLGRLGPDQPFFQNTPWTYEPGEEPASQWRSPLRTAGALIAGVAAGIFVVLIVVLVLGKAQVINLSGESSIKSKPAQPALIETATQDQPGAEPDQDDPFATRDKG